MLNRIIFYSMERYAGRLTVLYVFLFRAVAGDAGGPKASIMGDDSVRLAHMLNTADHIVSLKLPQKFY